MPIPPDDLLIQAYRELGVSADRIATSSQLRQALQARLPQPYNNTDALARRLISLRKRGKLPRTVTP